jgi:hypothetical protein
VEISTSEVAVGIPPHQLPESNQSLLILPNQLLLPDDVTVTLNVQVETQPSAVVAVAVTTVVPIVKVEPDAGE